MSAFLGRFTGNDIAQQLHACIGCQECLRACPSIAEPISVSDLNAQTLAAPLTYPVARFARSCTLCGACVSVCPVGLHRDAMMLWLKMRLLSLPTEQRASLPPKPLLRLRRYLNQL
ncbi:MAG: (Fe-S)-binding protein [Chloroflexota bacterium]|nr:(Fe-S)-binding protein [Chloroflexota bacterium]